VSDLRHIMLTVSGTIDDRSERDTILQKYGSVSLELHSSFIIDIITRLFDLNDISI